MAGRKLSKSSITTLRRALSEVEILKAQIRQGSESGSVVRNSSPHYIVETPVDGIPAASGSPLQPGSAVCKIYWREGSPRTLQDTNRNQTVYNYQTTSIPGSSLVLAHKDGWGNFWVDGSGVTCSTLAPGSYPAVAGATIAGGATGTVVYDGQTYQAVNQSACDVLLGDLVGLHVSPSCEAFFVPCTCSCSQTPPSSCCDKSIGICINSVVKILSLSGGSGTWSLVNCCDCDSGASVTVTLSCTGTTVTATWVYTCGDGTDTGTFDLSGLCSDPVTEYDDTITMRGCDVQIIATTDAENCGPCSAPPDPDPPIPTDCCENSVPSTLWLEIDGVSYAMVYDGSDWVYSGPISGCATSVIFKVTCTGGTFTFVSTNPGNNCSYDVDTQSFVSCSPFELDVVFEVTDPFATCGCVGSVAGKVTS